MAVKGVGGQWKDQNHYWVQCCYWEDRGGHWMLPPKPSWTLLSLFIIEFLDSLLLICEQIYEGYVNEDVEKSSSLSSKKKSLEIWILFCFYPMVHFLPAVLSPSFRKSLLNGLIFAVCIFLPEDSNLSIAIIIDSNDRSLNWSILLSPFLCCNHSYFYIAKPICALFFHNM